jgi:hypothetical protein
MNKTFTYNLPEHEANKILNDGFYVKINKGWTATIRCLADFIQVLESGHHEVDPDLFGIITKESKDPNKGNFYHYLIDIICKYKGFAKFNNCKHTFVELEDQKQTITIKSKSGHLITVCVMENAGCVDILYHNSGMDKHDNGSEDGINQMEVMGFLGGGTPIKRTNVSLMTILLGDK